MTNLDLIISMWDEGHRELMIALEGVTDFDLWKRPSPQLLSIGELAGHVTYYEAAMTVGRKSEEIQGILVDERFNYYTDNLVEPITLDLGADKLILEVGRIHQEAKQSIIARQPDFQEPIPWRPDARWGQCLQYLVFHVAYHAGQIYSARHLLGHETEDN